MHNPMDISDRTILVTGASSGIGRETAVILSRLGARLILVARNENKLQEVEHSLAGSDHIVAPYDLQNLEGISDWLKQLTQKYGKLHGLVHSAGIHLASPLKILKNTDINKVLDLNVVSAINLIKTFRQKNVCHQNASIVLLSSVAGLNGQAGISAYSASKGALIALTKSLALELADEKIRVNCVAPGVVSTEMTAKFFACLTDQQINRIKEAHPLGLGQPQDVGNAIAFLLADTARWITGSVLVVDGGYTAH